MPLQLNFVLIFFLPQAYPLGCFGFFFLAEAQLAGYLISIHSHPFLYSYRDTRNNAKCTVTHIGDFEDFFSKALHFLKTIFLTAYFRNSLSESRFKMYSNTFSL